MPGVKRGDKVAPGKSSKGAPAACSGAPKEGRELICAFWAAWRTPGGEEERREPRKEARPASGRAPRAREREGSGKKGFNPEGEEERLGGVYKAP